MFWITKTIIDFTILDELIANLIVTIYKHSSATNIVKCLILEIPENDFGFLELKKKIARGHAPELVISAMIGLTSHEKSNRNQIYKYIGKSNSMLRTITVSLSKQEVDAHDELLGDLDELNFVKHKYLKNSIDFTQNNSGSVNHIKEPSNLNNNFRNIIDSKMPEDMDFKLDKDQLTSNKVDSPPLGTPTFDINDDDLPF